MEAFLSAVPPIELPLPLSRMESIPDVATEGLPGFDYDPRTRVVFGAGALQQLGKYGRELGATRALLVTDHGLKDAGHEDRALEILSAAGIETTVYDDVHSNPTTDDVEAGTEFARPLNIDLIIGLGGGSSMDCAKGINFLLTNGGKMQDYKGIGRATKPMLPLIAVPTTAGTGSEAQSFAVIGDARTHMKMACGDKKAAARVAILDPELTATLPRKVAAVTGIDALSHALESHVCTKRNPVSQLFSRRSWGLLARGFPAVMKSGANTAARGSMLLGAHLAGAAIENSMLGATHALANPLTAHFDITHGIAIGLMLPHVIRFNAADRTVQRLYGELAEDIGLCQANDPEAGTLIADHVRRMVVLAGHPTSLEESGVTQDSLEVMAAEAAEQWTGTFNPRRVDAESLLEIYQCAFPLNADRS